MHAATQSRTRFADESPATIAERWRVRSTRSVQGRLGVEAVNVTNEQEVISINFDTGQADPGKVAYQSPREYRLQIGITF